LKKECKLKNVQLKELIKMFKVFIFIGSIAMMLAVMFGAFGSHGLQGKLSEKMLNAWNTGVHYHLIHAIALLVIAMLLGKLGSESLVVWAGWFIFAGIILFSGSLYALSLTGISKLGIITPFGGTAFIVGWILLAIAALK
jgi:uncharacterized membrane protein YgdD (TMEM256/DUF423 family)